MCVRSLLAGLLATFVAAAPFPSHAQSLLAWPGEGTPQPYTTSGTTATLASAGATVGLTAGGLLLLGASGYSVGDESPGPVAYVGMGMAATGMLMGPSLGNILLLGREDYSASRGMLIRVYGCGAGLGVAAVGLLSCAGALLGSAGGSGAEGGCGLLVPAAALGGVIAGGGIIAGTVYDFAAIPRNAERAREAVGARRAVQIGLAPVAGRPGVFAVVPL